MDWEIIDIHTPVSYPSDGVSHFRGLLDNFLISRMHTTLILRHVAAPANVDRAQLEGSMTQPMPATRRQHWAQINEFSFVAGMRLLFSTCRILGRWPFRIVLYPVLLWYMLTKPEARSLVDAITLGGSPRIKVLARSNPAWSPCCAILRHFAENLLDKMLLWSGLFRTDLVEFHGQRTDRCSNRREARRAADLLLILAIWNCVGYCPSRCRALN